MSRDVLADSPSASFLVPGLPLSVVVGGSQLASAYLIWTGHTPAPLVSLVSGCILMSWMVEAAVVRDGRTPQTTDFVLALFVVGLAWRPRQSAAT